MQFIERKGLDHVDVYKKAHIDRKSFSKIRSNYEYVPSKKTVYALAIAMELDLGEANQLLHAAGYHISRYILFDVIMEFFISAREYDLDIINLMLSKLKLPIF